MKQRDTKVWCAAQAAWGLKLLLFLGLFCGGSATQTCSNSSHSMSSTLPGRNVTGELSSPQSITEDSGINNWLWWSIFALFSFGIPFLGSICLNWFFAEEAMHHRVHSKRLDSQFYEKCHPFVKAVRSFVRVGGQRLTCKRRRRLSPHLQLRRHLFWAIGLHACVYTFLFSSLAALNTLLLGVSACAELTSYWKILFGSLLALWRGKGNLIKCMRLFHCADRLVSGEVGVQRKMGSWLRGGGGKSQTTRQEIQEDNELLKSLKGFLDSYTANRKSAQSNAQSKRRDDKQNRNTQSDGVLLASLKKLLGKANTDPRKMVPGLQNIITHADAANKRAGGASNRSTSQQSRGNGTGANDQGNQVGRKPGGASPEAKSQSVFGPNATKLKPVDFSDFVSNDETKWVPPVFVPSQLVANHWHGTVRGADCEAALDKISRASTGDHLVFGVFDNMPGGLIDATVPGGVTVTLVVSNFFEGCTISRAPAMDERSAPRVCKLYIKQLGVAKPFLNWKPREAKPLPAQIDTVALVVRCNRFNLSSDEWTRRYTAFSASVTAWLGLIGIAAPQIVDIWKVQKSECGKYISLLVRVQKEHALQISNASGISGYLARELPPLGKPSEISSGDIDWLKPLPGETGPNMMIRGRTLAEEEKPCLGLAFSNSGSIGVRKTHGACATSWRAKNLPTYLTIPQCQSWLGEEGWLEVPLASIKRRRDNSCASFVFRGKHPRGANEAEEFDIPHNGDTRTVCIEPWRPASKPPKFKNVKDTAFSLQSEAVPASAGINAGDLHKSGGDPVPASADADESAPKRAKDDEGNAVHLEVTPVVEIMDDLGLSVNEVLKDGACALHSLAWWFRKANKDVVDPGHIRTQLCDFLRHNAVTYEPFWDRLGPDGKPCATWNEYVELMRKKDAWIGELDLMAAADKWKLKLIILRPDKPTVIIGDGRSHAWLLLRNDHYEPLFVASCSVQSEKRKLHVAGVADHFWLKLKSGRKTFKLTRAGGRSSSSVSGTIRTSSSRASGTLKTAPSLKPSRGLPAPRAASMASGTIRSAGSVDRVARVDAALASATLISSHEVAAKVRGASSGNPWMCKPRVQPDGQGVSCDRCSRSYIRPPGSKRSISVNRFVASAPCSNFTGPKPSLSDRNQKLIDLGLKRKYTGFGAIGASRPVRHWKCPLCEFVMDTNTVDADRQRNVHLHLHGRKGKAIVNSHLVACNATLSKVGGDQTFIKRRRVARQAGNKWKFDRCVELRPSWKCSYKFVGSKYIECVNCGKTHGATLALSKGFVSPAVCSASPPHALSTAKSLGAQGRIDVCSGIRDQVISDYEQMTAAQNRVKHKLYMRCRRAPLC